MSSTYCNEPWKTIHYDNRGVMGPCCTYRGDRDEANFKKFVNTFSPIKKLDYQSYLPWSIK